jgi:hypothetical protein
MAPVVVFAAIVPTVVPAGFLNTIVVEAVRRPAIAIE